MSFMDVMYVMSYGCRCVCLSWVCPLVTDQSSQSTNSNPKFKFKFKFESQSNSDLIDLQLPFIATIRMLAFIAIAGAKSKSPSNKKAKKPSAIEQKAAAAAAAAKAAAEEAAKALLARSPDEKSLLLPPQRALMRGRNRVFEVFCEQFNTMLTTSRGQYRKVVADEQAWRENWAKMVSILKPDDEDDDAE